MLKPGSYFKLVLPKYSDTNVPPAPRLRRSFRQYNISFYDPIYAYDYNDDPRICRTSSVWFGGNEWITVEIKMKHPYDNSDNRLIYRSVDWKIHQQTGNVTWRCVTSYGNDNILINYAHTDHLLIRIVFKGLFFALIKLKQILSRIRKRLLARCFLMATHYKRIQCPLSIFRHTVNYPIKRTICGFLVGIKENGKPLSLWI